MALLTEPNLSGRGKREDLMDMIALVDAKDTPFTSMARKGSKPGNMYFRWQADSNPAPQVGGTIDGTDVSSYTNWDVGYRAELHSRITVLFLTSRQGFRPGSAPLVLAPQLLETFLRSSVLLRTRS